MAGDSSQLVLGGTVDELHEFTADAGCFDKIVGYFGKSPLAPLDVFSMFSCAMP